jgi:sporulation protein YlmC with PRC-barrel domain
MLSLSGKIMENDFKKNDFGSAIRTRDFLGKRVVDAGGKQIGKVGELLINPSDLCLGGIIVKRGLITTDLFISKNSIKNMSEEGVELLATPFVESNVIKVFDISGKQIGVVKSIKHVDNSHKIISIVID